jgi:hypothetical protein
MVMSELHFQQQHAEAAVMRLSHVLVVALTLAQAPTPASHALPALVLPEEPCPGLCSRQGVSQTQTQTLSQ